MSKSIQILMKRSYQILFISIALNINTTISHAQTDLKKAKPRFENGARVGKQKDGSYIVPTSQVIDPAGTTVTFSGRPVDLALNPTETILAVKNMYDIVFFDATTYKSL